MDLAVVANPNVEFKEIDSCRGMANAVGSIYLDDGVTLYGAPNKVVVHFAKTDNGGASIFFCMAMTGDRRNVNEEKLQNIYVAGAAFSKINTKPTAIAYMRSDPMKMVLLDAPSYDSDSDVLVVSAKVGGELKSMFDIL